MPLSEHEQRLLEQMERALYADDPKLASALRGSDLRSHYRRRAMKGVAGFTLGVILLMAGVISKQIAIGVVGFVVMLTAALFTMSSWKRMPGEGEIVEGEAAERPRGKSKPQKAPKAQKAQKARFMDRMEERWRRRREGGR
ncbi:MAG: DUF3040 domain-containing protein [Actinomycetes bacterium]